VESSRHAVRTRVSNVAGRRTLTTAPSDESSIAVQSLLII
jgi:hypothetical protein